jgi:endonuclease/exonuclease/phosphatase family metal-dependent hydrolase
MKLSHKNDDDNGDDDDDDDELKDLLAYDAEVKEEEVEGGEVRLPRFDRNVTSFEIELEGKEEEEDSSSSSRIKMSICSTFTFILIFISMVMIIAFMWEYTELDYGDASSKNETISKQTNRTFTYLQYNIDEGGGIGTSRYGHLLGWISSQHVDVVGFCELNHWENDPGMTDRALAMGFKYSHLYKTPSGYNLGIASRFPFSVIEETSEGFERGVLHVRVETNLQEQEQKWDVFVVHLNAHNAIARVAEAIRLNEMITEMRRDTNGDTIVLVTGDFNTLSPYDSVTYDHENLLSFLLNSSETHLRDKLTSNGEISYESFEIVLNDSNLVDPCAFEDFNVCGATEPTSVAVDQAAASAVVPDMRLDYILIDRTAVLNSYVPVCTTIRNVDVVDLSDHFPIRCVFVLQ